MTTTTRSDQKANRLLGIYLNDHLAGATAGVELAKRVTGAHEGMPVAAPLQRLTAEIIEDRQALVAIMTSVDVTPQRYKRGAAWLAERVGRLKLNGHVLSRSPLSSLVELEMLRLGVEGKGAGWRTLLQRAPHDDRLDTDRLEGLLDRACRQSAELEELRAQTAASVITGSATAS